VCLWTAAQLRSVLHSALKPLRRCLMMMADREACHGKPPPIGINLHSGPLEGPRPYCDSYSSLHCFESSINRLVEEHWSLKLQVHSRKTKHGTTCYYPRCTELPLCAHSSDCDAFCRSIFGIPVFLCTFHVFQAWIVEVRKRLSLKGKARCKEALTSLKGLVYLGAEGTAEQRLAQVDTKIAEFKVAFAEEPSLLRYFKWWEVKRGAFLAAFHGDLI
jgi:hypothetical protein